MVERPHMYSLPKALGTNPALRVQHKDTASPQLLPWSYNSNIWWFGTSKYILNRITLILVFETDIWLWHRVTLPYGLAAPPVQPPQGIGYRSNPKGGNTGSLRRRKITLICKSQGIFTNWEKLGLKWGGGNNQSWFIRMCIYMLVYFMQWWFQDTCWVVVVCLTS